MAIQQSVNQLLYQGTIGMGFITGSPQFKQKQQEKKLSSQYEKQQKKVAELEH